MFNFVTTVLSLCIIFVSSLASAQLYSARGQQVSVNDVIKSLNPGTVLIVSELHDSEEHHNNQVKVVDALIKHQRKFHVGMEFFSYPDQDLVDGYLRGIFSEKDFLNQIGWMNIKSYDGYREQVLAPLKVGGTTRAINAPRMLTSYIAKNGYKHLPDDLEELMPPLFEVGNHLYYKRFKKIMGNHIPSQKLFKYFAAQSVWDDTMAWKTIEFMKNHPNDIFVIIVGDFHASYGGGLKDRLQARGMQDVVVISQVIVSAGDQRAKEEVITPHPDYGDRAEFIWVTEKVMPTKLQSSQLFDVPEFLQKKSLIDRLKKNGIRTSFL